MLGILIGAALYAEVYPLLTSTLLPVGAYGKLTFSSLLGVNHWAVIAPLFVILGGLLFWIERRGW